MAVIVSVPIFAATVWVEHRAAQRQEILENLRFVRDNAGGGGAVPFGGLNLRGADLAGLDLGCKHTDQPAPGSAVQRCVDLTDADMRAARARDTILTDADLRSTDLRKADLMSARLVDADLRRADVRGADLTDAELQRAHLDGADLRDANLTRADLSGAFLRGADLRGAALVMATLDGLCFDDKTKWPTDAVPPAPDCPRIILVPPDAGGTVPGSPTPSPTSE